MNRQDELFEKSSLGGAVWEGLVHVLWELVHLS